MNKIIIAVLILSLISLSVFAQIEQPAYSPLTDYQKDLMLTPIPGAINYNSHVIGTKGTFNDEIDLEKNLKGGN